MAGSLGMLYDRLLTLVAAWALEFTILKGLARLTMWKIIYLVAFQFPSIKKNLVENMSKENQMEQTALSIEHWQDTVTTFNAWRSACRSFVLDMRKEAKLGGRVLGVPVVDPDRRVGSIADYQRPGHFLCVYIEEAHPSDGWAFSGNIDIRQHKTIDSRLAAAEILSLRKPSFPIVVDSMTDEANIKYGGLFERLYVFRDDVIEYQGGRGPSGCHVAEVEQHLLRYKVHRFCPV
ncbi:hypothetical protein CAPTEDRAFT_204892 [Capitella teleta]|uniref:Iodothyronine deiodinase n=1 Tax=Capitella teleta TaxID=283909 RepID=R7U9I5_CAPTE|nr:hypothetical protein CAPTEDRAFT_204892 [Capitella teleta]|eukprot:ELU00448.1 hypothetical protein CAPTEDRAFT_204892 [Capitella teleta]